MQILTNKLLRDLKKNAIMNRWIEYYERKNHSQCKESENIEIIKFGKLTQKTNINNISEINHYFIDFIIYSDTVVKYQQTNNVIYFKIPDNYNYRKCNFRFISLIIVFSDTEQYSINLNSESENYYVENNRFNRSVFLYLISKKYNVFKDEDTVRYTIELIDHEINYVKLKDNCEIILNLDDYKIVEKESNAIEIDYVEVS